MTSKFAIAPLPLMEIQLLQSKLVIKHPAYPDEFRQNDLLTFYARDLPDGGLHAPTVLLACGLVACNEFNGYLTRDRAGNQRLNCDNDQILSAGQYYFHVPHPPSRSSTDSSIVYKYPVYPDFSHWAFPHRNVPQAWHSSDARLDDIWPVTSRLRSLCQLFRVL